jgi:capsular polysaccharide biosynthesis protein
MEQNNFTFGMLVRIIRKRFKIILLVGIVAVVGSAIFSGPTFITPKYKSQAIVYPINLYAYGMESLTEQMLQLSQSNEIRDSLIEKFGLVEVYKLNPDKEGFRHNLLMEYNDHVIVSRTNYESVRIEVFDENPERARDMANEMIKQINIKARKLERARALERLKVAKDQLDYQQHVLDSINSLLSELRLESKLLDYEIQTERVTEGYMKMLSQSNVNAANLQEVRTMLDNLTEKGGVFMALTEMSRQGQENYNELFIEYQEVLKDVNQDLSFTNVIASPEVADKKALPVRWLIVLSATVSALLVVLVVLLLFEKRVEKA